jgi:hypothetical protein
MAATMASENWSMDVELKTKSRWSVHLGAHKWTKHTYERSHDDALQPLGLARRGLQSGALAKLGNEFVLVVGDHVTHLSHADNRELATAHAKTRDRSFVFQSMPAHRPVVIVVKRRRVVIL